MASRTNLDEAVCRSLLASTERGHMALSFAALPVIVPVRFALSGPDLVVGLWRDERIPTALDGNVVCVATEAPYPWSGEGWTVSVTGMARLLFKDEDVARARWLLGTGPVPWGDEHYACVHTDLVAGRAFGS